MVKYADDYWGLIHCRPTARSFADDREYYYACGRPGYPAGQLTERVPKGRRAKWPTCLYCLAGVEMADDYV